MIQQLFDKQGFVQVADVLSAPECEKLASFIAPSSSLSGGTRNLINEPWCVSLASKLQLNESIKHLFPAEFAAVQCTYFEKSSSHNWLVPFHQDLSIPVAERVNDAALSGWSSKEGVLFVHAPTEVLKQLIAVRLHIDNCVSVDGPLRVLAGSHKYDRIHNHRIKHLRELCEEVTCAAKAGDILAMRPLLLHASSKSLGKSKRRVLHFLYGPKKLPHGLSWQYMA